MTHRVGSGHRSQSDLSRHRIVHGGGPSVRGDRPALHRILIDCIIAAVQARNQGRDSVSVAGVCHAARCAGREIVPPTVRDQRPRWQKPIQDCQPRDLEPHASLAARRTASSQTHRNNCLYQLSVFRGSPRDGGLGRHRYRPRDQRPQELDSRGLEPVETPERRSDSARGSRRRILRHGRADRARRPADYVIGTALPGLCHDPERTKRQDVCSLRARNPPHCDLLDSVQDRSPAHGRAIPVGKKCLRNRHVVQRSVAVVQIQHEQEQEQFQTAQTLSRETTLQIETKFVERRWPSHQHHQQQREVVQDGDRQLQQSERYFGNAPSRRGESPILCKFIVVRHSQRRWDLLGNLGSAVPKSSSNGVTLTQTMFPRHTTSKQNNTGALSHVYDAPKRPTTTTMKAVSSSFAQNGTRRLGSRGRIFAAGLAVAACFWHPANATRDTTPIVLPVTNHHRTLLHPRKHTGCRDALVAPWSFPRGGDFEQTSHGNAFLPPQRPTRPLEFGHGTTTLSLALQGGIIAVVDSRTSMGQFVGSKTIQKVLPVSSHILGTMAGGAADCQHWIRKLKAEALLHELTEDGRRMSVARASRVLSNLMYGTMIMGYDDDGGTTAASAQQPYIYYVDNTGFRIQGDMFSVGSGSTFALGILDSKRAPTRQCSLLFSSE